VRIDRLQNFGFLLKDLGRRYSLRFEQRAREHSLTLMQCKALVHLSRNEGASQARLAELTDMEPMMMVRILDRMEADRLLERRPDPADRRARRLYLTSKAKPLLDEVWRLADATRNEMFAGVPRAERDAFMRILESVHDNACALCDEPTEAIPNPPLNVKRTRAPMRRDQIEAPRTQRSKTREDRARSSMSSRK
jgi:DNA-binding MarR family transcriptional regulator